MNTTHNEILSSDAKPAQDGERAEFVASSMNGKQHDTGRVETKSGSFFASTANLVDAQRVANALNAALLAADKPATMSPDQISEVNESLWAEIDEIKEKTGYNKYRESNRGVGHWTLLGYLLNLKHRAEDKPAESGEEAATFEQAWAKYEAKGFRYGRDALEQVRFGWKIAHEYTKPQADKVGGEVVAWAWRFHAGEWEFGKEAPWHADRSGYEKRPLVFGDTSHQPHADATAAMLKEWKV